MNKLDDSLEATSAILHSFREFSIPEIEKAPRGDSSLVKDFVHVSINEDENIHVNNDIIEEEVISAGMDWSNFSPVRYVIGYGTFKEFKKSGFSLLHHHYNVFFHLESFRSNSNQILNILFQNGLRRSSANQI